MVKDLTAKIKAKVFERFGTIYIKIHEEEIKMNQVEDFLREWRYGDLIEFFDGDKLIFVYSNH